MEAPRCSGYRTSISSTTRPANRLQSTKPSAAGRSLRSAIPTAISSCCSGRRSAAAYASAPSFTTDAEREYAYDRQAHFGRLDVALVAAAVNKWNVIDMKKDWKVIFPFEKR